MKSFFHPPLSALPQEGDLKASDLPPLQDYLSIPPTFLWAHREETVSLRTEYKAPKVVHSLPLALGHWEKKMDHSQQQGNFDVEGTDEKLTWPWSPPG